jgi:hypothetical protein
VYETGGREAFMLDICRDIVIREMIPKMTLAAAELGSIQKLTLFEKGCQGSCFTHTDTV